MMRIAKALLVSLVLLLPSPTAAFAQAGPAAGALPRLRGVILDPSGAVMPAVDVSVLQETTVLKVGKTDETGNFSFDLPIGDYRLAVTAPDFKVHTQAVRLTSTTQPLRITLALEGITSFIEVGEREEGREPTVDASTSLDATVITAEQVQELPEDEESLLAYLQALAGGEGNATLVIDGFEGGRLPTRDQIAQIVIEPNSFNANGTGPRITITSREPGPTRWSGNLGFNYRDSALNARTPGSANKTPMSRSVVSTSYNGPVIRGKWGLTVNLSKQQSESGLNALRAVTVDGPVNTSFVSPSTSDNISLTNNLYLSQTNSLLISFGYNRNRARNQGIGGFTLPERASNNNNSNWNFQVANNRTLSPTTTTTLQFRVNRNTSSARPVTSAVAINVLDAFNGGGAQNLSDSRGTSMNLSNVLRWTPTPKWNLQIAFNANYQSNYNYSENNYLGTFTFSSLEDYLAGRPLTYTQTSGNPLAETRHVNANTSVQATYRLRENMSASLGVQYTLQNHFKDYNNFSPTAQYQVRIRNRTTISIGARMTHPNAGFPVFYYEQLLRGDGTTRQFNTVISNPSYPDPFAGGDLGTTTGTGNSITVRGPNLESPYTMNSQVSVNQTLPKNWRFTASFNVNRAVHQIRTRNINAPLPGTPLDPTLTREAIDRLRPFFPMVGRINQLESTGNALGKNLNFTVQIPSTRRLFKTQLSGTFRYGVTWNSDDNGATNLYDVRSDWARTGQRQTFQGTFSVRPPVVGSFNFNVQANSGRFYSITTGRDENYDQSFNDRPFGVPRNSLVGPGAYTVNLNYSTPPLNLRKRPKPPEQASTAPGAPGAATPTTTALDSLIQSAMAAGLPPASLQSLISAISSQPGLLEGVVLAGGTPGTQPSLAYPQMTLSVSIQNLFNHTRVNSYSGVITSPLFGQPTNWGRGREISLSLNTRF